MTTSSLVLERRSNVGWAVLSGEVDMDVVDRFPMETVQPYLTGDPFYVDLTEVEFIDSSVLAWLLRLRAFCSAVHLVGTPPNVASLLDVSGARGLFTLEAPGEGKAGDELVVTLPAAAGSSAEARRLVRTTWPDLEPSLLADIALITTELVNNARRHGQPAFDLRLRRHPLALDVGVLDRGPVFERTPSSERPDPTAERGRGLFLIARLAHSWSIEPLSPGRGKTVWATVALQRHLASRPSDDPVVAT